ncbi:hypothetical protein ACP4OV_023251 [Aristida adscensionis]
MPVPLQLGKLEDTLRRREPPPRLQECCFHFSAASVAKLKARANADVLADGGDTAAISSLQAVLSHLWRSVCRARRLAPSQETTYVLLVGYRGKVGGGVPPVGYVGNAVVPRRVASTAGEVTGKGLGWAARLLNRAAASCDAAAVGDSMEGWTREQRFVRAGGTSGAAVVVTGGSPRFDVYGNGFGWGKPVGVRGGPGNKGDGKSTVYEGRGGGGAMALEVCLAADAMARLVVDEEFMDAVTVSY